MTIEAGDRVRYDADAQRRYGRAADYTGLVGEIDYDPEQGSWAWVSWNGGETFGWERTSNLEVV